MFLVSTLYGRKVDILSRNELGQFAAGAPSERRRQWVGERFGKLEVIGVEYGVQHGSKKRTMLTCRCDCGNIVTKVADSLKDREHASCGCDANERRIQKNRVDLTGQRFGRLIVTEMLWVKPHTKCRCSCDCGNEAIVLNTQLTSGKTTSCGCVQREKASEANTKDLSNTITEFGIVIMEKARQNSRGVWLYNCICPVCGNSFEAIPAKLIAARQVSCGCSNMSKGEAVICSYLDIHNVRYVRQFAIDECRDKNRLRFDVAIVNENGDVLHLIEYDGMQHYVPVDHFGGYKDFQGRKRRDQIKNDYCNEHNIPLTRLPYTMSVEEIEDTLENIINP